MTYNSFLTFFFFLMKSITVLVNSNEAAGQEVISSFSAVCLVKHYFHGVLFITLGKVVLTSNSLYETL